ncbi:MAG: UDP-glucose/GDP-mannose dehydrogenase family protein [Lachnospiraceae bacterium]|nr:UDP-glucose/GDP-mannose dehydrogenase family protein [Lachnospiraceae bacterium]
MSGPSEDVCFAYSETLKSNAAEKALTSAISDHLPRLTVVGAGYVGLVTAAAFASMGYSVICTDTDTKKIKILQEHGCPFFEPQLEELLNYHSKRLRFTSDASQAYREPDVVILSVGTPESPDGSANLHYIYQALQDICDHIDYETTIIIKSTVPPGTSEKIKEFLQKNSKPSAYFHVVSNPEFLSQGSAVRDIFSASRIIIGTESKEDAAFMERLYKPFHLPIVSVSRASAEMIKYASNGFLALKISYINEIANLCEQTGADIQEVVLGMGKDPRIGFRFLRAGIGYGGACFPKDTKALRRLAVSNGGDFLTIKAAIDANTRQQLKLIEKARKYYKCFHGLTVTFLGITFKPNTDDLRGAPSLSCATVLLNEGAKLKIWDPLGAPQFRQLMGNAVELHESIENALCDSDLCMIFTEWKEICNLDPQIFQCRMKMPIVLDGRNCFELSDMYDRQIYYDSIGRKAIIPDNNTSFHQEHSDNIA